MARPGRIHQKDGRFSGYVGTSEVPAALDRGVVDGAITASSGYGYVWRDLFKYNYRLNLGYVCSLLLANKRAWDKLSPSVQTA